MTQVDSQNVTVGGGGATTTITLSWQTSSSNPDDTGGYEATAASDNDTDTALFTVGSRSLSRFVTGFGNGAAATTRTATAIRAATGAGSGAAAVTRTASATRAAVGSGGGVASASWVAPDAWALPASPGALADVLLTPSAVETTYDELTLSATVPETKRDALSHYRRAGDVDRETTAFGAFRRLRRDGDDLLTVRPPESDSPPFADRRVAPLDMSAEQIAPRLHEVALTLGVEEPRAREPIAASAESLRVDALGVTVGGGATEAETLSWTPDGTQLGDWTATASAETDSDSALITVSDAPWTFSWPVATLALTERRVGQVERDSDAGLPSIELPLRLDASQVATILAVGSRIEAVETRAVPDAPNTVVDTLPGDELTCGLGTPTDSNIADGTYVLRDWSVEQARPSPPAYDATVTLVRTD